MDCSSQAGSCQRTVQSSADAISNLNILAGLDRQQTIDVLVSLFFLLTFSLSRHP